MGRKKKGKSPPPRFATSGTWHTHHTIFFDDQLLSPAYKALTANAKEVYTILRMQYKGPYSGDSVKCPYSYFEQMGIRRETVSKSLEQLECLGFIDIDRGGLEHRPSEYKLTDRWKKMDDPAELKKALEDFQERMDRQKKARAYKKKCAESHTS